MRAQQQKLLSNIHSKQAPGAYVKFISVFILHAAKVCPSVGAKSYLFQASIIYWSFLEVF